MNAYLPAGLGSLLLAATLSVSARDAAPRYKFTAGQTNAYAVEFSVRSENGSEVSTGMVIVATAAVTTNSAVLSCTGNFHTETKRSQTRGPGFYPGWGPGNAMSTMSVFPNGCEIEIDLQGNEIRDGGDYALAAPLGKLVQSLFAPLPAKSGNDETRDTVTVLAEPLWLGPAENFMNTRAGGPPWGMNYGYMNGQRNPADTLRVVRQTALQTKEATAEGLELRWGSTFASPARLEGEPRFKATSETELALDQTLGLLTRIETKADVYSQGENTSRHAKVEFKARLLGGTELAALLAPPPPPAPPRALSGAELEQFRSDLKSPELETRRAAVRQLNGVNLTAPTDELLDALGALALDSDQFTRMTAASFLGNHATTNQLPVLIKLLKDADWTTRQAAAKALGRLHDERAAQPLADTLARNSNISGMDISSALINLGPGAEKAVLTLLNERNVETQRQACTILQQIGTSDSLAPLQKLMTDADTSVSQAAADAVRAITQRQ